MDSIKYKSKHKLQTGNNLVWKEKLLPLFIVYIEKVSKSANRIYVLCLMIVNVVHR